MAGELRSAAKSRRQRDLQIAGTKRTTGVVTEFVDGTHVMVSLGIREVKATIPVTVEGITLGSSVIVRESNSSVVEAILSGPAGAVEYISSANQSVANSATARLTNWDTDTTNSVDRGSWTDDGAGLFTCVRPGRYRVQCDATVAGGGSGYWQLMIRVNGTAVRRSWYVQGSSATTGTVRGSYIYAEGDTVDIAVFNSTGAARNVWGGSIDSSWLTIQANP